MNRLRSLAAMLLLLLSTIHTLAKEPTDTTYTFMFCHGRDMFLVPTFGNDTVLERLEKCVDTFYADIVSGSIPLYVDGFCNSAKSDAARRAIAKIRSNRVKSELIVKKGLKEKHFITANHPEKGDFVTVRMTVPAAKQAEVSIPASASGKCPEENIPDTAVPSPVEAETVAQAGTITTSASESMVEEVFPEKSEPQSESISISPASDTTAIQKIGSRFSLRANLLRYATLTPDLGIEWHVSPEFGVLVNSSYTSWCWNSKQRRYALWEVAPELRWYPGGKRRAYVGVMYKFGSFNYKFSETGRQGDIMGGGITGGYMVRLNENLLLDLGLGLGYIHADTEKYIVSEGVRLRHGKEKKHWWGPVSAGVTLSWTIN